MVLQQPYLNHRIIVFSAYLRIIIAQCVFFVNTLSVYFQHPLRYNVWYDNEE